MAVSDGRWLHCCTGDISANAFVAAGSADWHRSSIRQIVREKLEEALVTEERRP